MKPNQLSKALFGVMASSIMAACHSTNVVINEKGEASNGATFSIVQEATDTTIISISEPDTIHIGESIIISEGGTQYSITHPCFYLNGIEYTIGEKYASVSGYDKDTFKGKAKIVSGITYKGIFYNVEHIAPYAFIDCERLTAVAIPNSIKSIGLLAFGNCDGLTSVTIPASVTRIWPTPFSKCDNLKSIKVARKNPVYDSRNNCNAIIETSSNTLTTRIKNSKIPTSVTSIGYEAFAGSDDLTSFVIPEHITSIESGAFAYCQKLSSITIPSNVTKIGSSIFRGCENLTSMVVAEGNPIYDSRDNCNAIIETATNTLISGYEKSIIPASVTSIGDSAFWGCNLTSVTIPSSVTSIGNYAFQGCDELTSVTIPSSVTSIGDYAFQGCNLTSVTIPSSVTSIGNYAFWGCNLTSVTIPSSVTSIGNYAFQGCDELTSVTIPSSVTSIGDGAFSFCRKLKDIHCQNTTPPNTFIIGIDKICTETTIYVPQGSIEAYKSHPEWSKFKTIVEE